MRSDVEIEKHRKGKGERKKKREREREITFRYYVEMVKLILLQFFVLTHEPIP